MVVKTDDDIVQTKYERHNSNDELPLTTGNISKMEEGENNHSTSQDGLNGAGKNSGSGDRQRKKGIRSKLFKFLLIGAIVLILLLLIAFLTLTFAYKPAEDNESLQASEEQGVKSTPTTKVPKVVPDAEVPQGPSASILHTYANGAVCSDSQICSDVGRDIFQKGGNVIDAAIATLLCNGITTLQSLGIGGGFIMNFYQKSQQKAYTIDGREVAPLHSSKDMFANLTEGAAIRGPLSIAVPGELAGYHQALYAFGTLNFSTLIDPSIKICEKGFPLTRHMYDSLHVNKVIKNDTHLRKMFVDDETDEFYPVGTLVKPPQELCQTYRMLQEDGPLSFYNGKLADMIAADLDEMGSIITRDDLEIYQVDSVQSISVEIDEENVMYAVPPVGSGTIVAHILSILKGYNMTKDSIANDTESALTYHRMIEAFKFAYAKRSFLGDLRFNHEAASLVTNLTADYHGEAVRRLIDDNKTYNDPKHYGADFDLKFDHGTSHLSLVAPNGDAVSVTSTVNFYFGCGQTGTRTGIIFNSGMDDFSQPGKESFFGLPASKTNFIEPRKRAMSSMSPTIITNRNGVVKLVVGAAGGSKIPSALSQIIARVLWLNQNIKEAIDAPRIHHQLIPNLIEYEYGVLKGIVEGLKKRGHTMKRYRYRGSVVCGIQKNETALYVNADYRKEGGASGF